jgi:hypothetical protein
MPATATTLIASTTHGTATGNYDGSSIAFQSDSAKGDGYYGYSDGLHTVSWQVTSFIGDIKIQASLVETPGTGDWFDVTMTDPAGTTYTSPYDGSTAQTAHVAYNFTGNFVNVRASITNFTAGTINKLRFNY